MDVSRHALLRCACPLVTPRRRSPEICRPREICRKKAKPDWLPNCPVDVAQLPQNSVFFIAIGRLGGSVTSELQPRNSIRGTLFDNKRGVQNVGLCRERWKASGVKAFGLDIPSCRNLPLRNANGVCLGEASPPTSHSLSSRFKLPSLLHFRKRSRFPEAVEVARTERPGEWKIHSVREAISEDWSKLAAKDLTPSERKAIREHLDMNIAELRDLVRSSRTR